MIFLRISAALILIFLAKLTLAQVFLPMAFWGPALYIPPNASLASNQCPSSPTATFSFTLPYKALNSPATSCNINSQSASLQGVPVCLCAAGVCNVTGLTFANTYLASLTPGVNATIFGAIKYQVSNASMTSAEGSMDLVVNTQTWNLNCLGSLLKLWLSSMDAATVTTSYNTTGQYATGTNGAGSFTSSVPPTYPIGSKIRIAGNAQVYDVTGQSISGAGNFNGDFEKPVLAASSFIYYGSMSDAQKAEYGWEPVGGAVLYSNGSAWGYPNVPSGTQGMTIQGTGSISQTVYFPSTGSFTLTWNAINRNPIGTYPVNPYTVKLDGVVVGGPYSQTSAAAWQARTLSITIPTVGYHTITIDAAPSGAGDFCVGLDNFKLNSTVTVSPNLVANYTNQAVSVLGVSQWSDKSTHANHMAQTISSANYPTWTTNYAATGKAALLFNGGNLFLTDAATNFSTGTGASSIFTVAAQTSPASGGAQYALGYGGVNAGESRNVGKNSGNMNGQLSMNGTNVNLTAANWSSSIGILSSTFSAGTMTGNINGNTDSTGAAAFNTSSAAAYIGRGGPDSNYWAGAMFEVLVVDYGMTAAERTMIEGFLAWKYSITGQLPAGHKYKTISP